MQSTLLLSAALATNVKVFAKSFRQRIKYCIFDALTKAFCIIFGWCQDIADKRAFLNDRTKRFTHPSMD
jgi:hypothetical protein